MGPTTKPIFCIGLTAGMLVVSCVVAVPLLGQSGGTETQSGQTEKSVLVVSLRSATQAQRCSNATLMEEVFTGADSVRAYFVENSYGLASISGVVSGPYTIATGSTCDLRGWADQADSAASAAGLSVRAYDLVLYILPPESDALACIPGEWGGGRAWIRQNTCDSKLNIAHEMGHAFGAGHSGISEKFVPRPVPSAQQTVPRQLRYADLSSAMGGIFDGLVDPETERLMYNATPHFTAPQKIDLGWLPASNVQTVTAGGSYRVASLADTRTDVQVLKVLGGDTTYYLSYRRAAGFDSFLLSPYVDKTSVHTFGGDDSFDSSFYGPHSTLHAIIGDGQSYSNGQFTVTQERHDDTHVYLNISFP